MHFIGWTGIWRRMLHKRRWNYRWSKNEDKHQKMHISFLQELTGDTLQNQQIWYKRKILGSLNQIAVSLNDSECEKVSWRKDKGSSQYFEWS